MSNLQKIIAENEKEFESEIYEWYSEEDMAMALRINKANSLRLIEGFREMVREKRNNLCDCNIKEPQGSYNWGVSNLSLDLLSELNEIK
jgi:hypothetical protein